jgi:hypothetical protein
MLIARKDRRRHPRVAARWLLRYLEACDQATIDEAAMVASCLRRARGRPLPGRGLDTSGRGRTSDKPYISLGPLPCVSDSVSIEHPEKRCDKAGGRTRRRGRHRSEPEQASQRSGRGIRPSSAGSQGPRSRRTRDQRRAAGLHAGSSENPAIRFLRAVLPPLPPARLRRTCRRQDNPPPARRLARSHRPHGRAR